jgi:hypothetical protein
LSQNVPQRRIATTNGKFLWLLVFASEVCLLKNLLSRFSLQDQNKLFDVFKANTVRETALVANREIADLKVALNAAVVVAPGMACFFT